MYSSMHEDGVQAYVKWVSKSGMVLLRKPNYHCGWAIVPCMYVGDCEDELYIFGTIEYIHTLNKYPGTW